MVSIIILSYNTETILHRCLASIFAHLKKGTFEVIVVDNDSKDDSVSMVKKSFPQVHLIENKENVGFAKGCNIGAEKAQGEYVLFLNSDIELSDDICIPLVHVFNDKTDAGVVGGKLVNTDGTPQRSFGPYYTLGNVYRLLFGGENAELKIFKSTSLTRVDWVSGGMLMIKKDLFADLHGFDEHFFMYIEDMELCYRVSKRGLQVYHEPAAVASHVGQGSSNRTYAIVAIYKGLQYFYKKHKNPLQYSILVLLLWLKAILVIMMGLLTGRRELVSTYRKALRTL